jgi:serine/threonine protein kinase
MPAPATNDDLLDLVRKSGVLEEKKLDAYLEKLRASSKMPNEPSKLAGFMVADGLLTNFQAEQLMLGKWRRFNIGKYKVLERLGQGGMGSVFLCEHKLMRRRVAVKVLPTAKAEDPSSLERFYREARAVAALDHPNIVRAYDIDQDDNLHFLVMEYVDGASLQEIVKKVGPLDVLRTCHYMRQAALGLAHAHETAGLVHRDIKPGNILVDRNGVVKILDMGLARFFHDEEDILTKKYDENVLGTADYLAPEQALDSHGVDIRADIYSLGATFYFCLTSKTPFSDGTVAQKLIWHQTRQPKPIRSIRPEVPEEVAAIVEKMMAKEAAQRNQTPQEVMAALEPWTQTPIGPPSADEMPRLCPAAMVGTVPETATNMPGFAPSGSPTPTPRKSWQVSASPSGRTPTSVPPVPPAPPKSEPRPSASPPRTQASGGGAAKALATAPARVAPASPRSGANGPRRAESKVTQVAPGEDSVGWERLAPDTDEPTAQADTSPTASKKRSSVSSLRPTLARYRALERRRLILVVSIVSALVVAALIITLILVFGGNSVSPEAAPPPQAATIYVSRSGKEGALKDLTSALRALKTGGRIVVRDGPIEVDTSLTLMLLDGRLGIPKEVTVEVEAGQDVIWRLRKTIVQPPTSLLTLSHLDGFTLRGFTFDGEGRVKDLVTLTGTCPGLKLENLKLQNFQRNAVAIFNCQGKEDRPILISQTQLSSTKEVEAGFTFDITKSSQGTPVNGIGVNRYITITKVHTDATLKISKLVNLVRPEVIDKTVKLP